MLASVWASVSLVSDDFSSLVPWLSGEIWRERFLSMNRYE
jgi:hypothetical protein